VLRSQLTVAVGAVVALAACASIDGTDSGGLRENVIEPGITAIEEADVLACGADADALRSALEIYETLEGEPAPDEAALVDSGFLRNESELWDVVDGEVVAQGPECGAAAPATTIEIVTEAQPDPVGLPTVDEVMAGLADADIEAAGGVDCVRQLAVVVLGVGAYEQREGGLPESIEQLDTAGLLSEPVDRWELIDGVERPVEGSGCVDLVAANEAQLSDDECVVDRRTLEVTVELYRDRFGVVPASEQDLVDASILRNLSENFDVTADGRVVPSPDGACN